MWRYMIRLNNKEGYAKYLFISCSVQSSHNIQSNLSEQIISINKSWNMKIVPWMICITQSEYIYYAKIIDGTTH